MANYSFDDYKQRISIMQVALELGYRYDRTKGRSQPSFVLYDSSGKECDRIYVKNPNDNARQGYWRRSLTATGHQTGDLISFVKENLHSFIEYSTARNDIDAINKVLARMAGVTIDNNELMKNFMAALKERPVKPFSLERYEREPGNVKTALRLLNKRGIKEETLMLFKDNFEIIHDKESKNDFKNIAFPFRLPGKDKIKGYEVRGYNGFKSKSEGTDSTNACWMAYVGTKSPEERNITELHFAESALDSMAFVQLNKEQLDLDECLFISFGGSFSKNQMQNVLNEYTFAKPVLHFDNDLTGVMYDCETAAIMAGKDIKHVKKGDDILFTVGEQSFSIPLDKLSYKKFREGSGLKPDIRLWKAPGKFKDWNDLTIAEMENIQIEEGEKIAANEKIAGNYRRRGL